MNRIGGVFLFLLFSGEGSSQAPGLPAKPFPEKVVTIHGKRIDVKKLAQKRRIVVITLKATWCVVCQDQLRRIREKLPEAEACGISYIVLSPGPEKALRSIERDIGAPFPYIEDRNLEIARSLGIQMSDSEILPSILILNQDLTVGWIQRGRGPDLFGDQALLDQLKCAGWI